MSRGTCPACITRIGAFQAAFKGRKKPFACEGCGALIQKTNSETVLAVGAFTSFWIAQQRIDNFWVLAAIFLLLCVSIILKSKYRSQIELVEEGQSDAAQNPSISSRN